MTVSNPFADLLARQPASAAAPKAAAWMQDIESATFAALRSGATAHATAHLVTACRRWPAATRLHRLDALLLRENQAHEAALDAAARAADAALTAQLRYETGRTAAAHFAAARVAAPGDTALIRGHAGALVAEGQGDEALALIARETAARPDWVEGHAYHATLARLLGANDSAIFAQAVQAQPHSIALRLNWFHWLARLRDWPAARAVLADATHAFGDTQALTIARLYLIAESGEGTASPTCSLRSPTIPTPACPSPASVTLCAATRPIMPPPSRRRSLPRPPRRYSGPISRFAGGCWATIAPTGSTGPTPSSARPTSIWIAPRSPICCAAST